jgi:hypothetical protein
MVEQELLFLNDHLRVVSKNSTNILQYIVNTPVQLHLLTLRLKRAELEVKMYSNVQSALASSFDDGTCLATKASG